MAKGGLLMEVAEWIIRDERFLRWVDDSGIDVLWVRGGAGKGKTMMSIGLIETLQRSPQQSNDNRAIVVYFFCQNADQQLNTAKSVLKGLLQCLFEQSPESRPALRELWDDERQRPLQRAVSLQELWDIFQDMIERFRGHSVRIVVDALDECEATSLKELMKLIAYDGVGGRVRVKWLLTSRPHQEAANTLLPGGRKIQLDLEMESLHMHRAIQTYISRRVADLDCRHQYGLALRQQLHNRLVEKAEDTFLWVSLACQQLENVLAKDALSALYGLPSGLHGLYTQAFYRLRDVDVNIADSGMRLLRVMMLAFRPLRLEEVRSVVGPKYEATLNEEIVQHCTAFIRTREGSVEFVHQSARDFLSSIGEDSKADLFSCYGHGDMALNAVTFLTQHLETNMLNMPWPPTTRAIEEARDTIERHGFSRGLGYAALFWMQHLVEIAQSEQNGPGQSEVRQRCVKRVDALLRSKVLEWFECLSLLRHLGKGIEGLKEIVRLIGDSKAC
jgi:hypothetical protein